MFKLRNYRNIYEGSDMQLKIDLGKRIQYLRKQENITQEVLGNLIGIDSKNVSKIEKGINYPSPETLTAIANALNVEFYELFLFDKKISYDEMKQEIINELTNKNSVVYLYNVVLKMKIRSMEQETGS